MPDVLVAGGGPTGLLTAFELERAGLDVLVLERDARPATQSKALGLQPRSVEVLADRGLLAAIEPHVEARLPGGHFSGIPIDYSDLPTPFPYQLGVEQAYVAAAIEARLRTPVQRDAAVTVVEQDAEGVTVTAGGRDYRAGWLVAADGGHSTVRTLLGGAFPGTPARFSLVVADLVLAGNPAGWAKTGTCHPADRGSCYRFRAGGTGWSSPVKSSSGSAGTRPSRPRNYSGG
ncbi:FAD-dependent oxidoreductase [Amycolatopsis sp. NBC_01480]|uniref:FAD-dependent oxidoreductase n=1 Tax=Amycolatopsis sp. NBC_01480 TaxID=2903562 RepID=UPI002E2DF235|nr:FAD-dependent oxidoreductase [Amycolatopsis sp. NBC_01480]